MARYCFKCSSCGAPHEYSATDVAGLSCALCGGALRRDYQGEAVGIGAGVRASRDGTMRDQAELFLPSNRDFAGPGDPDGTKGMRDWRENHKPTSTNSKPYWPGTVEKKVM